MYLNPCLFFDIGLEIAQKKSLLAGEEMDMGVARHHVA